MSTRTRRRLKLPETFAFTTIGVFTVAAFACGTSSCTSGAESSASSASSSTGMGGASSSNSSSSSSASSSSGSTCTPDGGMCVVPGGGDQQTIYKCVDFGEPEDAGCPTGYVCTSTDCPSSCEPQMFIYCPSDAGCEPSGEIFECVAAQTGSGPCPSDYVCSTNDCPTGCIGEPVI